ncbi:nucleotidyltransferase domain-containing protein [Thermococcus argininiproducens]|uniref:Nucleotidyltransferase domain-containing protein n=1 Tax=Thermococcus argininiproducens TaxID=2866384 RepID=A0A9E7MBC0_9EURY|nr:nucleotidyltransferase domain-containing protein [Thermococcus argininiproducens]USH00499.1 nucleotidyltransferase domain-containing protein [Thermococcus argininiproducens]
MNLQMLLRELKENLKKALGDEIEDIILYGSYARGDYSRESDIDILLVVKEKLDLHKYEKVNEIATKLSLKYEIVISIMDYPKKDFMSLDSPFLQSVKKEGIKIE